jgi:tripartite-type tricarboxylate transporter receptor subunit TctC
MIDRRAMLGASLAMPFVARAQGNWPDRPIRMIVGFAAGGGTDITTRTLTPKMSEVLGQPIVVENRPGASGNIATEAVVRAPADGYTLLMGTIAALAINPTLFPSLPFNPATDLTPISMSGNILNILVCPADRPWRTVPDLVAAARAQPDKLTYGSSGVGGSGHLGGAMFDQLAGIKTIHVPYRGGGPLANDLAAGSVDFSFATASSTLPLVEGGRVRLLAVPTAQRSPLLPNVPTVAETVPGYELANWNAVVGPKGLPAPIVERVNTAVRAALGDARTAAELVKHGVEPTPSSPAELARFIREETAKWAPVVRASGATPT